MEYLTKKKFPKWNLMPIDFETLKDVLNETNGVNLTAGEWLEHYSLKKKEEN